MATHFKSLPQKVRKPDPELPPQLLWVFSYDDESRLVKTAPFDNWDMMERYLTWDKGLTHQIYWGQFIGTHSPTNNFLAE